MFDYFVIYSVHANTTLQENLVKYVKMASIHLNVKVSIKNIVPF